MFQRKGGTVPKHATMNTRESPKSMWDDESEDPMGLSHFTGGGTLGTFGNTFFPSLPTPEFLAWRGSPRVFQSGNGTSFPTFAKPYFSHNIAGREREN